MTQRERETIQHLQKFKEELDAVNQIKYQKGINFFDAVGMTNLETKHSRFFVWLFDESKPHNFNKTALEKFCELLVDYQTRNDDKTTPLSNTDILAKSLGASNQDFEKKKEELKNILKDFIDGKITVTPEVKIDAKKTKEENRRYIDILIETSKAVIVIENKVDSDSHTDQLQAYEDYINKEYVNLKKIFIYLSPKGALPYNKGGNGAYNDSWCVIDYKAIVKIVQTLQLDINNGKFRYDKKEQKNKMKVLLEDYEEMVKTDILKESKAVRALCREILKDKKLKNTFDMMNDYMDNIASYNKVLEYCRKKLEERKLITYSVDKSFVYFSEKMEKFFKEHNEQDYKQRWRCQFSVGSDSEDLNAYFLLMPNDGTWSKLQEDFLGKYENIIKKKTQATVVKMEHISGETDRAKFMDDIQERIDDTLEKKVIKSFEEFESKLLNMYNVPDEDEKFYE